MPASCAVSGGVATPREESGGSVPARRSELHCGGVFSGSLIHQPNRSPAFHPAAVAPCRRRRKARFVTSGESGLVAMSAKVPASFCLLGIELDPILIG